MKRLAYLIPFLLLSCRTVYVPIESVHYVLKETHDTIVEYKVTPIFVQRETRDTTSHLEAGIAFSDAKYSKGTLTHSLGLKDTSIRVKTVYYKTTIRDTITVPTIKEKIVKVEKPLTAYQSFSIRWMTYILIALGCFVAFQIYKIVRKFT